MDRSILLRFAPLLSAYMDEWRLWLPELLVANTAELAGGLMQVLDAIEARAVSEERSEILNLVSLLRLAIKTQGGGPVVSEIAKLADTFHVNDKLRIQDSWISEFEQQLHRPDRDVFFEEAKPRRYKTKTYYHVLYGIEGTELVHLATRFGRHRHPYVDYWLGSTMTQSHNFSSGLPWYERILRHACSHPNHYWHTPRAVEGCAYALYDVVYFLSRHWPAAQDATRNERIRTVLLKLCFMYQSRYIYMTNHCLNSVDLLTHRAQIVKGHSLYFHLIFPPGTNPDIQYFADYATASRIASAEAPKLSIDLYYEAKKQYDFENNLGDLEDATFWELVDRGNKRSVDLTARLHQEYKDHEIRLSPSQVSAIVQLIQNTHPDDMENRLTALGPSTRL